MNAPAQVVPPYRHTPLFPLGPDRTTYRKLTSDGVRVESAMGREVLVVEREALRALAEAAFVDINHLLRPGHLASLKAILEDPEASDNDRFVAYDLLKNANIAAGGVLPMCQDTGTAIIMGKKGRVVWTDGDDEGALAEGARDAYLKRNLRYSQLAPISMFEERNTRSNMPAQVEIYAEGEDAYKLLFIAKGGGSANKSFLFQATPSILTHDRLDRVPQGEDAHARHRGLPALSPGDRDRRHLGGADHEDGQARLVPLSRRPADARLGGRPRLPRSRHGGGGAPAHPVARRRRAVRRKIFLPRRAGDPAAAPRRLAADRARRLVLGRPPGAGKITRDGVFLEELEHNPAHYLPEVDNTHLGGDVVKIDLNQPMPEILAQLARYPIKTRLSLTGPMIVARDLAHAKLRERLERGRGCRTISRTIRSIYAGPAKTPDGYASGAFGPTTAGRMDSFVDQFQAAGGSMVMLAKGNRSAAVREACAKHGGFYLGSIGGAAANLAEHCIKKVETVEYPELGMEAIWRIEVEDFPAFIVIDDKGNDFFKELNLG